MAIPRGTCPLDQRQIVDRYFPEHRRQILDIAAFLDRLERAARRNGEEDFRLLALRSALATLAAPGADYAVRIQTLLSDPNSRLLSALGRKDADGAFDQRRQAGGTEN